MLEYSRAGMRLEDALLEDAVQDRSRPVEGPAFRRDTLLSCRASCMGVAAIVTEMLVVGRRVGYICAWSGIFFLVRVLVVRGVREAKSRKGRMAERGKESRKDGRDRGKNEAQEWEGASV